MNLNKLVVISTHFLPIVKKQMHSNPESAVSTIFIPVKWKAFFFSLDAVNYHNSAREPVSCSPHGPFPSKARTITSAVVLTSSSLHCCRRATAAAERARVRPAPNECPRPAPLKYQSHDCWIKVSWGQRSWLHKLLWFCSLPTNGNIHFKYTFTIK